MLYATCSVLRDENEDRIEALLATHPDLLPLDAATLATKAGLAGLNDRASPYGPGLRITPRTAGTDGFYIAALSLAAG